MTLKRSWKRIRAWLQDTAPEVETSLNKGASKKEIQELENQLEFSLPGNLSLFYESHNGQRGHSDYGLFYGDEFLSLKRVGEVWHIWNDLFHDDRGKGDTKPSRGVKNNWWNPGWLPITSSPSGDSICIDLDPGDGGNVGQVIQIYHDDSERSLLANSFEEWIEKFCTELESGAIVFSRDFGIVNKKVLESLDKVE